MSRSRYGRTGWFKSTRSSETQTCVEVRFVERDVLVRDSKYLRNPANDPESQPCIRVPKGSWDEFLQLAASKGPGVIALNDAAPDVLTVDMPTDGEVIVASSGQNVKLLFTSAEWDSFVAGITCGEFVCV